MLIMQICEDDWIQIFSFFSRPQLFRLALVHRIFHQLIQNYFPEYPLAIANLAIWVNQNDGELWAGICIYEWDQPRLAWQFEDWKKIFKTTKWLGTRLFNEDDSDNNRNEDLNAMKKCYRIVEIFQNGAHKNCPDDEWVLDEDWGCNDKHIEVVRYVHSPHLKEDEAILLESKKYYNLLDPSIMRNLIMPVNLMAKMPLASNNNTIAQLILHLDVPFIRVQNFSILQNEPPFWAEMSSSSMEKEEISTFGNDDEKNLQLQQQLFNFLELLFTSGSYQNTTISSIFVETHVGIEMENFVKILFNNFDNRQSLLDLLKRMGNYCHNFVLLRCKASHLQTNMSQWKALICNINGKISMSLDRDNIGLNNVSNILIKEEFLPLLYAYNPQENPERLLKISHDCDYWEKLLTILLELFNFLELLFTSGSYQNTTISSIFVETHVGIEMENFVKILFNNFDNRQSLLDLLKRMGNYCHNFVLLRCKASHLQTNMSQWKALICNINGKISMSLDRDNIGLNNVSNILIKEEFLPLLYAYNPQENPERLLKISHDCDYWEKLLTILLESKIIFDGRPHFADFILMRNEEENYSSKYYMTLMLFPTNEGCKMSIFQYRMSETVFHENLCKKAQIVTEWWKRCIQLYFKEEVLEGYGDPKDVLKNENCTISIIEDKDEIEKRWTNYILIKWLSNWRNFFDN